MKKFKAKKKRKISLFKISFFFILTIFFYYFFTNILYHFKLANSNQEFLNYMLQDTNYHLKYQNQFSISNLFKQVFHVDISSPTSMLETAFGYNLVMNDPGTFEDEQIGNESEYVYDPNPTNINNPKVYIYNTHQLESYDNSNYQEHNITPNVLMASYLLKEKLNKIGISTMIETANITEFLNLNGWNYYESYKASRFYAEETIKKYPDLSLIIDLHRDAIPSSASTTVLNNKNYAKILFVVGMEHENYEKNLELASTLNQMIQKKYPSLTRGIITKSGANVNGIYNQDLSEKAILIECGGYQNTMEEVINTLDILSEIIKEYIG